MTDIVDVRRQNIRLLVAEYEGMNALARKIGLTKGSYISQMLTDPPNRNPGEKTMRKWEVALKLPSGWLDQPHDAYGTPIPKVEGFNAELFKGVLAAVLERLQAERVVLSAAQVAELVTMQYQDDARNGRVDLAKIDRLIGLLKR